MNDELRRLVLDNYEGKPVGEYTKEDANEVIRQGLIEINGGSDKITRRTIKNGHSNGLFAFIEEIIQKTANEGLSVNDFYNRFVEYRNISLGDKNEFVFEDESLFIVADIADGTTNVRRQRLGERTTVSIPTTIKALRIYEEMNRVLSGRVDFSNFITKVGRSWEQKILDSIYMIFSTLDTINSPNIYSNSGSYDADELLEMAMHVEADTMSIPSIMGDIRILSKLKPEDGFVSESAKQDMYNTGYFGSFRGFPVIKIAQRHQVGTKNFIFPSDRLFVVSGKSDEGSKFIKHITEGEALIDNRTGFDNADMTEEYFYTEKFGVGTILHNTSIGIYTM